MGKRGYDPHEKQSSTISNAKVLVLMETYNFAVQMLPRPVNPKASVRHAVAKAKRQFGEYAHISTTGESVFFCGAHVEKSTPVTDVPVKLSNMLGIGEQEALYKATGIPELNPYPERSIA